MGLYAEAEAAYSRILSNDVILKYPAEHLIALIDLGIIYRHYGDNELQVDFFHRCIDFFQRALEISHILKDSSNYALINVHLGDAYYSLSRFENCDANFKNCFDSFNRSLSVYIDVHYADEYCNLLNKLCLVYIFYSEVRHSKKYLLKSISLLEKNFIEVPRTQNANILYDAKFCLGSAYAYLSTIVNCKKNTQKSLEYFDEALNYFTLEDFPINHANILINKSVTLGSLVIFHNSHDACQESLRLLQVARNILVPENTSMSYGILQLNLSATHTYLAHFENPRGHIDQALLTLDSCSNFFIDSRNPFFYGKSLTNFAELYIRIAEISFKVEYLERAITDLNTSFNIFLPTSYPSLYGMNKLHLGHAYYVYYKNTQNINYLMLGIDALAISSSFITLEDYPLYHGLIQFYLGNIFRELYQKEQTSTFFMSAKNAYTCATDIFTQKNYPEKFIEVTHELHNLTNLI